jgi:hypothetical protein
MSEVVQLSSRRPQRRIGPPARGPADICLFTGVRYERPPEPTEPSDGPEGQATTRPARRRTRPA